MFDAGAVYITGIMAKLEFALFGTPIGCCGIVWSGRGVVGVQLPEGSERANSGPYSTPLSGGA